MLPEEDKNFVNPQHIEAFAKALRQDDDSGHLEFIISKNDWTPVNEKIVRPSRKRKKGRKPKRTENKGIGYHILRWPALILVCSCITALGFYYLVIRVYVALYEHYFTWRGERRRLREQLRKAKSYDEWIKYARKMDECWGLDSWKHFPESPYYNYRTLEKIVAQLREMREQDSVERVSALLEGCVKNNFAGTEGVNMYSHCYYGTKDLIAEFKDEVVLAIEYIVQSPKLTREQKRFLVSYMGKNYGRSALCLSGGACFAYYHLGVIKALLESNLLPSVITGTSGGALVAALACCWTEDELRQLLVPELAKKLTACSESTSEWIIRWWKTGARFDSLDWAKSCQYFTRGSMTFKEAYQRTGKILNISTVPADPHSPVILCNYITSPNAVIWSALLASAAVPGILNPVVLMMKTKEGDIVPYSFGNKWKDGSLRTDIPLRALNTYFHVNFPIVSQVNPHVSLFFYSPRGTVGRPVAHRGGEGFRGGFLISALEKYIKLDISKWLRVAKDLEIFPKLLGQDWSNVFLQNFRGSVTIWPKAKLTDFYYILSDPNEERLARMIATGEQFTYPKMLFVKHRLQVEQAIEKAFIELRPVMPTMDPRNSGEWEDAFVSPFDSDLQDLTGPGDHSLDNQARQRRLKDIRLTSVARNMELSPTRTDGLRRSHSINLPRRRDRSVSGGTDSEDIYLPSGATTPDTSDDDQAHKVQILSVN